MFIGHFSVYWFSRIKAGEKYTENRSKTILNFKQIFKNTKILVKDDFNDVAFISIKGTNI